MASGWLQAMQNQMRVAETLLNAVDEVVSKKVAGVGADKDGQAPGSLSTRPSTEQEGGLPPLPTSKRASFSDGHGDGSSGGAAGWVPASGSSPFGSNAGAVQADRQQSSGSRILQGSLEPGISTPSKQAATSSSAEEHSSAAAVNGQSPSPMQPTAVAQSGSGLHQHASTSTGTNMSSVAKPSSLPGVPPSPPSSSAAYDVSLLDHAITPTNGISKAPSSKPSSGTPPTPPTSNSTPLPLPASMSVSLSSSGDLLSNKDLGGGGGAGGVGLESAAAAGAAAGGGATRESQLSRVVEQLKDKLRVCKLENEQLEDMLAQAEARCERERALVVQLRAEVAGSAESQAAREAALTNQLNAQASSLQELGVRCEGLSRQVVVLEGELAVARESSRSLLQNKTDLEGGMVEALRAQLAATESQLDAEQRAHAATRAAAVRREGELEGQLAGNGAELAELQRSIHDYAQRIRDAEDALAMAQARNQELQQQGAGTGQAAGAAAERLAALQQEVQQLHTELEVQGRSLQQSETARVAALGEAQTLRTELQSVRAELEAGARHKDAATLEVSLHEAHELLYQKQATIERLSADRAALQLRLEREVAQAANNRAQHAQAGEAHHVGLNMGAQGADSNSRSVLPAGDHAVVPTGSALGARYRHLASRPDKLGRTLAASATLVDRTTSLVVHLLRQYPLLRLAVLAYVLLLHLYIYVLTLRMQHAFVALEGVDSKAGPGAPGEGAGDHAGAH